MRSSLSACAAMIALVMVTLATAPPAGAANTDAVFRVESVKTHDGLRLFAVNRGPVAISANVDVSGTNLVVEPSTMLRVVVPAGGRTEFGSARPGRKGQAWRIQYRSRYLPGDANARHDDKVAYRLPFPDGSSAWVSQAPGGELTTHRAPGSRNAIDFVLPEGAFIVAARDGVVIEVEEGHSIGARNHYYRDKANVVRVLHADGSIASYAHLAKNSVLVARGEWVREGMLLARVGNTGYSSGPHLHFEVTEIRLGRSGRFEQHAVPVQFRSGAAGPRFQVSQGSRVTAGAVEGKGGARR